MVERKIRFKSLNHLSQKGLFELINKSGLVFHEPYFNQIAEKYHRSKFYYIAYFQRDILARLSSVFICFNFANRPPANADQQ